MKKCNAQFSWKYKDVFLIIFLIATSWLLLKLSPNMSQNARVLVLDACALTLINNSNFPCSGRNVLDYSAKRCVIAQDF